MVDDVITRDTLFAASHAAVLKASVDRIQWIYTDRVPWSGPNPPETTPQPICMCAAHLGTDTLIVHVWTIESRPGMTLGWELSRKDSVHLMDSQPVLFSPYNKVISNSQAQHTMQAKASDERDWQGVDVRHQMLLVLQPPPAPPPSQTARVPCRSMFSCSVVQFTSHPLDVLSS